MFGAAARKVQKEEENLTVNWKIKVLKKCWGRRKPKKISFTRLLVLSLHTSSCCLHATAPQPATAAKKQRKTKNCSFCGTRRKKVARWLLLTGERGEEDGKSALVGANVGHDTVNTTCVHNAPLPKSIFVAIIFLSASDTCNRHKTSNCERNCSAYSLDDLPPERRPSSSSWHAYCQLHLLHRERTLAEDFKDFPRQKNR